MTLDSYEFTAEQNQLIADLARKMKGVAIFMAAIGAMALAGCVTSALRARPDLAVIAALAAAFFLAIAFWTFRAGREFRRVVDTRGHDIPHTMNALAQLRRFYTLHFWLIIVYLVLIVLAILGYPEGLGAPS